MVKDRFIKLYVYNYFEKVRRKKCARDNPERSHDQYTVPDTGAVGPTLVAFLY